MRRARTLAHHPLRYAKRVSEPMATMTTPTRRNIKKAFIRPPLERQREPISLSCSHCKRSLPKRKAPSAIALLVKPD